MLSFVKSIRQAHFYLYVQNLIKLAIYFFALDHPHYSRWLSVHIWDLLNLHQKNPELLKEFQSGNFVVHKTGRHFSAIALDHFHEQLEQCTDKRYCTRSK